MLLLLIKQESCADQPTKAGDNSKRELLTERAILQDWRKTARIFRRIPAFRSADSLNDNSAVSCRHVSTAVYHISRV